MKKIAFLFILSVGLILPWACTNNAPTGPLATYNLTATPTNTFTPTATNWAGFTSSPTGSITDTPSNTPTITLTPTITKTFVNSATPTNTATSTQTNTPTITPAQPTPILASTAWSTGSNPPNGLAYDGSATIYVAEGTNGSTGGLIQTFNISGTPIATMTTYDGTNNFGQPNGVACYGSPITLYVVDQFNNAVYEINPAVPTLLHSLTTWTSTGGGAPANFSGPEGIAVDTNGNVYVADTGHDYIEEFNSSLSTTPVAEFGGLGSGNGKFNNPSAVAIDGSGNIYAVDASNQRIEIFSNSYVYSNQFSTGSNSDIFGITLDSSGNIYLADSTLGSGSGQIEEYGSLTGSSPLALLTWGLGGSDSLQPDPDGLVFITPTLLTVTDYNNNDLYQITP